MRFPKYNKYKNKKVIVDNIKFDSKKESEEYLKLKYRQKIGEIKELKLQVPYELIPKYKMNDKTIRKTTYVADFVYYDTRDNKTHVIDVKGFKTQTYKLKKKMFEYKYGIEIEEV